MPSVLSPTHLNGSHHDHKSYAPLADEVNPPFGKIAPAPTVTRNGTIVYSKRVPSNSSTGSASDPGDEIQPERVGYGLKHRNDSEETLSADSGSGSSWKGKGKARAMDEQNGDGGSRATRREDSSKFKGKGKERAWDVEQGAVGNGNGNGHGGFASGGLGAIGENEGAYPPVNEAEAEERRIQDNLAKFAARDAARRRAARESRILPSSPNLNGPGSPRSSSSTSSFNRRPFSIASISNGSVSKRGSFMGIVEGLWTGKKEGWTEGELPMSHAQNHTSHAPYSNPYDTQPAFSPIPKMVISPTSPPQNSPFADHAHAGVGPSNRSSIVATNDSGRGTSNRRASLTTPLPDLHSHSPQSPPQAYSPLASPTDGIGFSYSGPTWRGGAGQAGQTEQLDHASAGGDKWWHALCAWGTDLDGGHDGEGGNQAGRTNPFE